MHGRAGRAKEKLLSEPVLPRMWTKLSGSARLASGSNLVPPRPDVTPASINALHYEGSPTFSLSKAARSHAGAQLRKC